VGGIGIPGVSISSRTEQQPNLLHIEPRFGASYALDNNTVIHAGFGIFRYPQASEASYSELGGSARISTSVNTVNSGANTLVAPGSSTSSPGYYSLHDPFYGSPNDAPPTPYGNKSKVIFASKPAPTRRLSLSMCSARSRGTSLQPQATLAARAFA
jgi:hypothetical protein